MKLFIFLFLLVWSNLKAQNLSYKYSSETLDFEIDTIEFKINPIRGNTQIGNWHQANEFYLFLLDDFDQNVQVIQIKSKKHGVMKYVGNVYNDYPLEGLYSSNQYLISIFVCNLGQDIVLYFHDSHLLISKVLDLKYKKLKKPQTHGYFCRKNFRVWLDGEKIVVPLDHYKIPDSIRSNYPLYGIFSYKGKPKVKLSNTFGYL